jgi:N-acetylgalactosamine-N,N'-diacetylbacillosaminyl-diphospho-undecaprenol 4-alpha-N-acetylgalactosaminyltransferase
MRKKLSILVNDLDSGGAERVVSVLLDMLKDRYDITLFLMHNILFYDISDEIKIVILGNSHPKESGVKKLFKLPYLAWIYRNLNRDADISISFLTRPCYITIIAKIMGMRAKVVINERAMPTLYYQYGLHGKINRFLIKKLYNRADIVVGNSRGNTIDLEKNFNIRDTRVINNLFDIEKIDRLSQEKQTLCNNGYIFITIGRLDEGKNHILLLHAIREVDARLYIIGDGKLSSYLEEQIEEMDLSKKVTLLGRRKNPYRYISKADCFLFASNHEGFPNVLVEALACRLPVISTDCQSGPREILAPSTDVTFQIKEDIELAEYGILTPTNNIESMVKAMKQIQKSRELQENYRNKSIMRAMEFDKDKIIDEFIKIL